jgi:hypothetical protein
MTTTTTTSTRTRPGLSQRLTASAMAANAGLPDTLASVEPCPELRALGLRKLWSAPLFAGQRLIAGKRSDWLLVNLAEDPLFHDPDGFPVPGSVLKQIRAIAMAGVDFDALYVAHELPLGIARPGRLITREQLAPPASTTALRRARALGGVSAALWSAFAAPLRLLSRLGAAGATSADAPTRLDPVLFGVIVAPGSTPAPGVPATWYYIAHWDYSDEG